MTTRCRRRSGPVGELCRACIDSGDRFDDLPPTEMPGVVPAPADALAALDPAGGDEELVYARSEAPSCG